MGCQKPWPSVLCPLSSLPLEEDTADHRGRGRGRHTERVRNRYRKTEKTAQTRGKPEGRERDGRTLGQGAKERRR